VLGKSVAILTSNYAKAILVMLRAGIFWKRKSNRDSLEKKYIRIMERKKQLKQVVSAWRTGVWHKCRSFSEKLCKSCTGRVQSRNTLEKKSIYGFTGKVERKMRSKTQLK
jgi:hypothetical protein